MVKITALFCLILVNDATIGTCAEHEWFLTVASQDALGCYPPNKSRNPETTEKRVLDSFQGKLDFGKLECAVDRQSESIDGYSHEKTTFRQVTCRINKVSIPVFSTPKTNGQVQFSFDCKEYHISLS